MDGNQCMTRKEVAEVFRVSVRTVDRLIKEGKLNAVRFGHTVRISRESVVQFIRNGGEKE